MGTINETVEARCETGFLESICPGGEIGRRKGLKILFPATGVWVQVPPRAPDYLLYLNDLQAPQQAQPQSQAIPGNQAMSALQLGQQPQSQMQGLTATPGAPSNQQMAQDVVFRGKPAPQRQLYSERIERAFRYVEALRPFRGRESGNADAARIIKTELLKGMILFFEGEVVGGRCSQILDV